MIANVRRAAKNLAAQRRRTEAAEEALAAAIREALAEGARAADIAKAAGISRARVYQIRDGRR